MSVAVMSDLIDVLSGVHEHESHKTLIVVDRGPKFAVDCAEMVKVGGTGTSAGRQTRWSCVIQAVIEFHRVLADLYPNSTKQLRLVVSDTGGRFTTPPWSERLLDYHSILDSFIGSRPDPAADPAASSILNGLVMCMDALTEPTPLQKKAHKHVVRSVMPRKHFKLDPVEPPKSTDQSRRQAFYQRLNSFRQHLQTQEFCQVKTVRNAGTVIAMTTIESLAEYKTVVESMEAQVAVRNELFQSAKSSMEPGDDSLVILPIHRLKLYVINVGVINEVPDSELVQQIQRYNDAKIGLVSSSFIWTHGGQNLLRTIHSILQENYSVQCTTVQNIPMKEESQASKSINYNVEMFHPRYAHNVLNHAHLLADQSPIIHDENGFKTVSLKWSTVNNKLSATEPPLFSNGSFATVAKVRDRAAICICNFIMNGKFVLMDMDPENRVDSLPSNFHDLKISHFFSMEFSSGAMLLNAMRFDGAAFRPLAPPFNPRLCTQPLHQLVEQHRLEPEPFRLPLASRTPDPERQQKRQAALDAQTRCWPVHETDSVLYQRADYFAPVLALVRQSPVSADTHAQARQFVFALIGDQMAGFHHPDSTLTNPSMSDEEKTKITMLELARILRNYAHLSPVHSEFYNFYLTVSGLDLLEEFGNRQRLRTSVSPSVAQAQYRRSRSNSPVPPKRNKASNETINLYDYFLAKSEMCWRGWRDFEGRLKSNGPTATLYPNLTFNDREPVAGVRPSDRRRNKDLQMEH